MHFMGYRLTPNGPNLSRPVHFDFDFSGAKLSFLMVEGNDARSEPSTKLAFNHNIYDLEYYRSNEDDMYEPKRYRFLYRDWRLWGLPYVHRDSFADAQCELLITHMPEFSNLFRPRRFEGAIERLLYTRRVCKKISPKSARLGWNTQLVNGHLWVNYQYKMNCSDKRETLGYVWQTQLTDEHILTLKFEIDVKKKRELVKSLFQEMMGLVVASLKLELSEDVLQYREKAINEYPYESLSQTLPPYDFEQMDWFDRLEMFGKLGQEVKDSHLIPKAEFDLLVASALDDQDKHYQNMRARIMSTHMRFTELEAEDLKNASKG